MDIREHLSTPRSRRLLVGIAAATALLILPVVPASAASGDIATYAGSGSGTKAGDGAQATAAGIVAPIGVAFDGAGNTYIAARNEGDVRKVAPDGTISTLVSGFQAPSGIAFDAVSNSLFLSSENDRSVYKITLAGVSTLFAGTGVEGYNGDDIPADTAQLNFPSGVAVDSTGNVFIADTENFRVREVTTDGLIHTVAGTGTTGFSGDGAAATAALISKPRAVAVDSTNRVLVADGDNLRVRAFKVGSTISTIAGNGTLTPGADGGQALATGFAGIGGIAVNSAGTIFVGEFGHRVRGIATDGVIVTVAGTGVAGYNGDAMPSTTAQLNFPKGIALSAGGDLYVADYGNNRVRIVTNVAALVPTPQTTTTTKAPTSTTAPPAAPTATPLRTTPGFTG